jgi:hypothetical protein
LVADRGADQFTLARQTRELLAPVAAHAHLGGNQFDHFGDVVANAHAFAAAGGARPLRGWHHDRVVDAPHMVWRGCSRVRLGRRLAGLWYLGRWRIDPRRCTQPTVDIFERGVAARRGASPRRFDLVAP